MMARLKRILAAAAILIVGGATVAVGLQQANVADAEPLTCGEWSRIATRQLEPLVFLVAIQDGTDIPLAYGGHVLGDCQAGSCVLAPTSCGVPLTYDYLVSELRAAYRLVMVDAFPGAARAWKEAAAGTVGIAFFSGPKEYRSVCPATELTGQQCWELFNDVNPCWETAADPGYTCRGVVTATRQGRRYGSGMGGTEACAVAITDLPVFCGDHGHGPAWAETAHLLDFPADNELVYPK